MKAGRAAPGRVTKEAPCACLYPSVSQGRDTPPLSSPRQKRLKAKDADEKKKLVSGGRGPASLERGLGGRMGGGLEGWARRWAEGGRRCRGLSWGPDEAEFP